MGAQPLILEDSLPWVDVQGGQPCLLASLFSSSIFLIFPFLKCALFLPCCRKTGGGAVAVQPEPVISSPRYRAGHLSRGGTCGKLESEWVPRADADMPLLNAPRASAANRSCPARGRDLRGPGGQCPQPPGTPGEARPRLPAPPTPWALPPTHPSCPRGTHGDRGHEQNPSSSGHFHKNQDALRFTLVM